MMIIPDIGALSHNPAGNTKLFETEALHPRRGKSSSHDSMSYIPLGKGT